MAMKVGLEYNDYLAGILSYSGYLNEAFMTPSELSLWTPIYAHHGEKDTFVNPDEAHDTYKKLVH